MARDGGLKRAFRRNASGSFFGEFSTMQVVVFAIAEVVGTAILLFLGCMGSVKGLNPLDPTHMQIAICFGLAVASTIQIIGHISKAHLNPAVTVCAWLLGHMNWATAVVYVLAECIGATLGYGLLKAVTPISTMSEDNCCFQCNTVPHEKLTSLQAVLMELLITSILIFVVCSVWDKRNAHNTDSAPLKFGFTIAAIAAAGGHYTGGSMNPARSLGPAIWNNVWQQHWVYWIGPVLGSIITTLFYKFVLDRDSSEEEGIEDVPLTAVNSGNDARKNASKEDLAL